MPTIFTFFAKDIKNFSAKYNKPGTRSRRIFNFILLHIKTNKRGVPCSRFTVGILQGQISIMLDFRCWDRTTYSTGYSIKTNRLYHIGTGLMLKNDFVIVHSTATPNCMALFICLFLSLPLPSSTHFLIGRAFHLKTLTKICTSISLSSKCHLLVF